MATPSISTSHTSIPSPLPGAPSFVFHLTRLSQTLMVWVGTASPTEPGGQAGAGDPVVASGEKKIATDWAVAMPPRGNIPVTATSVYRGGGDQALGMAQRLTRRLPCAQVHLSLSLPPSMTSSSGPTLDPYAGKVLLVMEKKLGAWLEEQVRQ